MIVMAPVIYTAAVDFTLNMLVEGFGPETQAILLLPPRCLIVIFISTDVLSGTPLLSFPSLTSRSPQCTLSVMPFPIALVGICSWSYSVSREAD